MGTRIVKRLFKISTVRKSLTSNNSADQKGLENDRLKTDDLLLDDFEIRAGKVEKIVEREKVKVETTNTIGEGKEKNNSGSYEDVSNALAPAFAEVSQQQFNQEKTYYNKTTPKELKQIFDKAVTKQTANDIDNKAGVLTKQTSNEPENRSHFMSETHHMTKIEKQTFFKLFPSHKTSENLRPPQGSMSFPPATDKPVQPPQADPEPSDHHTYQDYISERQDQDRQYVVSNDPTIYQDYMVERINQEGINDEFIEKKIPIIKNYKDTVTTQNNLNAARFKPHLRPKSSARDYHCDDYMWSPTVEVEKNSGKEVAKLLSLSQTSKKRFDLASMMGKPKTPELYAPHSDELKTYDRSRVNSNINIQRSLLAEQTQSPTSKEPLIPPQPFSLPGYKPTEEKPVTTINQNDYLKFTDAGVVPSYDLVPGPSALKSIGNAWKYVPVLGTQCISSLIYSFQSIVSYIDKNSEYPTLNPYYYLLNKYGPMVRLNGPLGADILVLAVNGQDFPLIHIKQRGGKYQSLFDSLNVYREEAPLLAPDLDIPNSWASIPDNPTITIEQHFTALDKVTEDFIKEKRFIYGSCGKTENESHENDLIRWALQCNIEVYFKSKKKCMVDTYGNDTSYLVDNFIKATKSLNSIETGLQLWRAFTTLNWIELVDHCKFLDRFILDEVNDCLSLVNKGITTGAALEGLLATEEIKGNDIFTSLLDLLLINVNIVASTTGFLLYNLSRTPQVQRSLFKEVSGVIQKGSSVTLEDLANLKYLNACITETLRMSPPFPVIKRMLNQETKIHRFVIPKGTYVHMVNILPYAKGSNGYSDIGKFQAERWTDKVSLLSGDPLAGLPQWNSFPKFNRDLVMTQIALLVTKVVRDYRIEYSSQEIHPNGKALQGPTNPFNFTFIERQI